MIQCRSKPQFPLEGAIYRAEKKQLKHWRKFMLKHKRNLKFKNKINK